MNLFLLFVWVTLSPFVLLYFVLCLITGDYAEIPKTWSMIVDDLRGRTTNESI